MSSSTAVEYIVLIGQGTGLTPLDILLLVGCPILAALGTLVSGSIGRVTTKPRFVEEKELPAHLFSDSETMLTPEQQLKAYNADLRHSFSLWQRRSARIRPFHLAFIGLVLGLVIALYFVGAIKQELTSVARILALCVLLGYQAPSLWAMQETLIGKAVEAKLNQLLNRDLNTEQPSTVSRSRKIKQNND